MTSKEQPPLAEITSAQVHSKARDILDLHGHPGTKPTLREVPRFGSGSRLISGPDMPTTEAPVVPIQIAGNDYRLWLRSEDDSQPDNRNGAIELSVHFQQLPDGLDRVEYDNEHHVIGYWYKPKDLSELKHAVVVRRPNLLPKELEFSWYMKKNYLIKPDAIRDLIRENFPPEIDARLGDSNDFLLLVLEEMQTKLESKSV